ncbi:MAG TPA: di-heme oxidoredictase family protein [Methylomirabilota bacterium]
MRTRIAVVSTLVVTLVILARAAPGQLIARDPGVRRGAAGAGGMLPGLTATQQAFFASGRDAFSEADGVGNGLGPRFNLDSCVGCHSQPAAGGTSPAVNPQVEIATAFGARNTLPAFVTVDGPVREARFKYKSDGSRDGGVHGLFVISGRRDDTGDATGCAIAQDDFAYHLARNNVSLRIPTPVFGGGLIEAIPDAALIANASASTAQKTTLGIGGRPSRPNPVGNPNRNGNDGTIARFGWKAQNRSLLMFAGEAYNVEQGISNELFPSERDDTPTCLYAPTPNDATNTDAATGIDAVADIQKFAFFMRFLAPPQPSSDQPGGTASLGRGRSLFRSIGCALCHTPALKTGTSYVSALSNQTVNLFSDLLLHRMGPGLADDIVQGDAGPDEFRTAPLWGLGQRLFFLHDGRTSDLVEAIQAHASPATGRFAASEANGVIARFRALRENDKQDLVNFLRSL